MNKEHKAKISYPITFQYDTQVVALQELPKYIEFEVLGQGWKIIAQNFRKKPISYKIYNPLAISYILPAKFRFLLLEELQQLKLEHIISDTFFVKFDKIIEKKIKVALDTATFKLDKNYKLTDAIELTPNLLHVKGPKSEVKKLPSPVLLEFPDKNIDKSYDNDIKVKYTAHPLIKILESKIHVKFQVEEYKTYTIKVPITKNNFPNTAKLAQQEVDITYTAKKAEVDSIKPEAFQITANYYHLNRKDSTVPIKLIKSPLQAQNIIISTPSLKIIHEN